MSAVTVVDARASRNGFRHEALLYSSTAEFVRQTTGFIREGLARDEAVLTVVDADKIRRLREQLAGDADRVVFADMAKVGHNPALIIQAWRDFVSAHGADVRGVRGIGEPISSERSAAALVECEIHEALLNVAFESERDFWLMCPYDTTALPKAVLDNAIGNHPFLCDHDGHHAGGTDYEAQLAGYLRPLPDPSGDVDTLEFNAVTLHALRQFVTNRGLEGGVARDRVGELVVAVSEIATKRSCTATGAGVRAFGPTVTTSFATCAGRGTSPIRSSADCDRRPARRTATASGSRTSSAISCRYVRAHGARSFACTSGASDGRCQCFLTI